MTLSKIRNLKRETLEYWKKCDLEISTLALAVVYFEKLIMRKLVIKSNRKLKFATCLLLAFKFNESTIVAEDDDVNRAIIDRICSLYVVNILYVLLMFAIIIQ